MLWSFRAKKRCGKTGVIHWKTTWKSIYFSTMSSRQPPEPTAPPPTTKIAAPRPQRVQTVALRVPSAIRGNGGRPLAPHSPLLPVFIAGPENRFVWFACQAPIGQVSISQVPISQPPNDRGVSSVTAPATEDSAVEESAVVDATNDESSQAFPPENWGLIAMSPLLLVGPAGCGKTAIATHLATRILDEVASPVGSPDTVSVTGGSSGRSSTSLLMPGGDFARYYARAVDFVEILIRRPSW